jgi:hypothetical protein
MTRPLGPADVALAYRHPWLPVEPDPQELD